MFTGFHARSAIPASERTFQENGSSRSPRARGYVQLNIQICDHSSSHCTQRTAHITYNKFPETSRNGVSPRIIFPFYSACSIFPSRKLSDSSRIRESISPKAARRTAIAQRLPLYRIKQRSANTEGDRVSCREPVCETPCRCLYAGVMRTRQRPPVSNVTVHHERDGDWGRGSGMGYEPPTRRSSWLYELSARGKKKEESNTGESDLITDNDARNKR